MRPRRATATAGAVLSLMLVALWAPSDAVAASPSSCETMPLKAEIVDMAVKSKWRPVGVKDIKTMTVEFTYRDPCAGISLIQGGAYQPGVASSLGPPSPIGFDDAVSNTRTGPDADGLYHASTTGFIEPSFLTNDQAGAWKMRVFLAADGGHALDSDPASSATWYLQRWSRLLNTATERARTGSAITITANLQRADWDDGVYDDAPSQYLELQQRTSTGSYKFVDHAYTDRSGQVSLTVPATGSSCFRYVFHGTSTTMAVKGATTCLAVR